MNEETIGEMSGTYWEKIKEAKENGITEEEFLHIEVLEGTIAEMRTRIDECEEEIMLTKKRAKNKIFVKHKCI